MPYADKQKQLDYQNNWMKQRRLAWLKDHGPCVECGSDKDLEVDHIDRTKKLTHRVWSWAIGRRDKELAKCQVLCHVCHLAKTAADRIKPIVHGSPTGRRRGCKCEPCRIANNIQKNEWRYRTGRRTKRIRPVSSVGRAAAL